MNIYEHSMISSFLYLINEFYLDFMDKLLHVNKYVIYRKESNLCFVLQTKDGNIRLD